jgi:hypothetical protein
MTRDARAPESRSAYSTLRTTLIPAVLQALHPVSGSPHPSSLIAFVNPVNPVNKPITVEFGTSDYWMLYGFNRVYVTDSNRDLVVFRLWLDARNLFLIR